MSKRKTKQPGVMRRSQIAKLVNRALDDFDDPAIYGRGELGGESRFQTVKCLLETIDWGDLPTDLVRDVFALVVERAPMSVLNRNPYGSKWTLGEVARDEIESGEKLRAEDSKTRAA